MDFELYDRPSSLPKPNPNRDSLARYPNSNSNRYSYAHSDRFADSDTQPRIAYTNTLFRHRCDCGR